ncbi:MAG: hypothetical protein ACHQRJ_02985 [Alphaproteobacteria bacterium]
MIAYEKRRKLSIFGRFPRHTKLLGTIAGLWGTLEHQMCELFEALMYPRRKEARAIFYSLGNHKARRDILRVAGATRLKGNQKLLARFNKAINAIKKRADRRNDLLHSAWIYFFDVGALLRYSPRVVAGQEWFQDKERDLEEFIDHLKRAINLVIDLAFDVLPHIAMDDAKRLESPSRQLRGNPRSGSPSGRQTPGRVRLLQPRSSRASPRPGRSVR